MDYTVASFQVLAASGVVGDSGKPIDVFGINVLSGGTAAAPYLKNGTGVSSPTVQQVGPCTVSAPNSFGMAGGGTSVRFQNGCYVSFDANTTNVTIYYIQALT